MTPRSQLLADLMPAIDAAIAAATRLQLKLYDGDLDAAMDAGIATGYLQCAKDLAEAGMFVAADKLAAEGERLLYEVSAKVQKDHNINL